MYMTKRMCICKRIIMSLHLHRRMCAFAYAHVYVHVHVYVCVCTHNALSTGNRHWTPNSPEPNTYRWTLGYLKHRVNRNRHFKVRTSGWRHGSLGEFLFEPTISKLKATKQQNIPGLPHCRTNTLGRRKLKLPKSQDGLLGGHCPLQLPRNFQLKTFGFEHSYNNHTWIFSCR